MADLNPISLWRKLLALPNTSRTKTVAVAFIVSAVSAVVVSATAVTLKPIQDANRAAESQARLEAMMATLPGLADLLRGAEGDSLQTVVVNLDTGEVADDIDLGEFDLEAAAADPEASTELTPEEDIAGIGRKPEYSQIYVLTDDGDLKLVILPVFGAGYQAPIKAFLALEGDLNTVAGLTITEQAETPGLGARIEEPGWQALWPGKLIADENGEIALTVVRGAAKTEYEVDGITGATRTSNAIGNMVRFWMGENGYGPVLDNLRDGGLAS